MRASTLSDWLSVWMKRMEQIGAMIIAVNIFHQIYGYKSKKNLGTDYHKSFCGWSHFRTHSHQHRRSESPTRNKPFTTVCCYCFWNYKLESPKKSRSVA